MGEGLSFIPPPTHTHTYTIYKYIHKLLTIMSFIRGGGGGGRASSITSFSPHD